MHFTKKKNDKSGNSGFGGKPKFERKGNDRNSFGGERKGRDGDWDCPKCHMNNFAFRSECMKCSTTPDGKEGTGQSTPKGGGFGNKPGDWICSQCSNDNFAFRTECKRCSAPKGDSEVVGGGHSGGFRGNNRGNGFRGGRGARGGGNGRGAGRGGRGGMNKSFGGFENKSTPPANKKIKFD